MDLTDVDASRADFSHASIEGCTLTGARFHNATLRDTRLRGLCGYQEADWIGADVRDTDFRGSAHVRRHVLDENYLHELRSGSLACHAIYLVWWATSDCGRNLTRWLLWCALLAVGFAFAYRAVPMDYGPAGPTALSPLLYSVATLTTLDEAGAHPHTLLGQALAMSEAALGYVLLAGLFSIVAASMGRRGD